METFTRKTVAVEQIPDTVRAKWTRSVLGEGFVPFPKTFLRTLHKIFPGVASVKELSAILAVVDFKRPNLVRGPSYEYLAFTAGLPVEEFRAAIAELERKGLVEVAPATLGIEIRLEGLEQAISANAKEEH